MVDLSAIPYCGAVCLVSSLSSSPCAPTDAACLCANAVYAQTVETCVLGNCTIREGLLIKNATTSACGAPQENRDVQIVAVSVFTIAIHLGFFVLRMFAKAKKLSPWGWDDTTIAISYALMIPWVVLAHVTGHERLGRNIWTLTPDEIEGFLFYFYVCEVLYTLITFLTKSSIIFLYMRIFPGKTFRIISWATQAVIMASAVSFGVADGSQCRPISFFWTYWDGQHVGTCINLIALAQANAVINIVLEVWMLVLPATQVWGLNMAIRKRIQVLLLFGFGILTIVISIIRMSFLSQFATTQNPTVDFFYLSISTTGELTIGFMVACVPAARMVILHYWPDMVATLSSGSASTGTLDGTAVSGGPNAHSRALGHSHGYSARVAAASPPAKFTRLADGPSGRGSPFDAPRAAPPVAPHREAQADAPEYYGAEKPAGPGEIIVQQDVSVVHSIAPQTARGIGANLPGRRELDEEAQTYKEDAWDTKGRF